MNIALDIRPLDPSSKSQHKVRGVGKYISLLKDNLEKYDNKNHYTFTTDPINTDADIVHYPYFDPFFPTIPFTKRKKTVVTVHDVIPLVHKKQFPVGLKGVLKWRVNKFLLGKVDSVIVDSDASKNDVGIICNIDSSKIHTVYLSADEDFKNIEISEKKKREFLALHKLPDTFFLYVGDVTWNKNLPRIVESVKRAGTNLVLVGKALSENDFDKTHPWNKDRVEVSKSTFQDPHFIKLGFVSTDDLVTLYNLAEGLLMPSLDEGFGLPALEAMKSGCPVVSSKLGSLPEVCADAAFYVDAYSVEDIVQKINILRDSPQKKRELSKAGEARAKIFSLEKMIKETVKVYESL